jgi:hypothetical protein
LAIRNLRTSVWPLAARKEVRHLTGENVRAGRSELTGGHGGKPFPPHIPAGLHFRRTRAPICRLGPAELVSFGLPPFF